MKIPRAVWLILLLPLTMARAVVLIDASGTTPGNTGATGIGVEAYVGQVNGASGIYLGDGWVLTAAHVSAGNFTLNGTTYSVVNNSMQKFYNTDLSQADLVLFQINTGVGGLPSTGVSLYNGVLTGQTLYMLGYGGGVFGWGTNIVPDNSWIVSGVHDPQQPYYSDVFATPSYNYDAFFTGMAQGIGGDSGGAVFILDGGEWKLAGVMIEVGENYSATYSVNMNVYSEAILAAMMIPEPSAWTLVLTGAGVLWLAARRRK